MAAPVLDDLKRTFRLAWWALVLRGLLALAVGILILMKPLDSIAAFALVIAFWAIFSGFTSILHAVELRPVAKHWWIGLLAGLVSVGFGCAALYYYPGLSLSFAVVMVSWWLTLTGFLGIYGAFMEKGMGLPWGWAAFFGAASVVAGVYALLVPPATLAAIMGLIAGFGIVGGILLLIGAFKVRAMVHG